MENYAELIQTHLGVWPRKFSTLNFHDIDYRNFTPHKGANNKVNKNLT